MFNVKQLDGKFAKDNFFSQINQYMAICVAICSLAKYGRIPSMLPEDECSLGEALDDFVHEIGTPVYLTFDGHQS